MNLTDDLSELPLENFRVSYACSRNLEPITRDVIETDIINAIIAARREERRLTTVNCPDCVLFSVEMLDS